MLHDLDLFYRIVDPSQAQLYARLPWPLETETWRLTGIVRGPFSSRGHTLPASVHLQEWRPDAAIARPGDMQARAVLTDPCPWSPDLPNLYDVTIELRRNNEIVESTRRRVGLRDLRPQRRSLLLAAKRWVLRGVHADNQAAEPPAWREAATVRVLTSLDDAWLTKASLDGALAVVRLDQRADLDVHLLRQIAQHASAALVVLPNPANLPRDVRLFAPNLLLAQDASEGRLPAAWAHAAWIDADSPEAFAALAGVLELPIIAVRRGQFVSLPEARAAIDALQADLAPSGQFAGYVV